MVTRKLRILVIEDEPLIAYDLADFLDDMGWECIGPVTDLSTAPYESGTNALDAAILNLIINGKHAYSVAEILSARNIPFGFASGVGRADIEALWQDRPTSISPTAPRIFVTS